MIQPSNVFKDNLAQLPAIDAIERIDLLDGKGAVVASIENKPGKQGSLAVYNYLQQAFGTLDAKAARAGCDSDRIRPFTRLPPSTPVTCPPRIRSWPCMAFRPLITRFAAPASPIAPDTCTPGM